MRAVDERAGLAEAHPHPALDAPRVAGVAPVLLEERGPLEGVGVPGGEDGHGGELFIFE